MSHETRSFPLSEEADVQADVQARLGTVVTLVNRQRNGYEMGNLSSLNISSFNPLDEVV